MFPQQKYLFSEALICEIFVENKYYIRNFFSTHYKHFYLISCFHVQRSHFYSTYTIMSHRSQNWYGKDMIRIF